MYSFMSKIIYHLLCFLYSQYFLRSRHNLFFFFFFFLTDAKAFGVDGYGAKASEKLMTVRGKDFRHEKTKKKRGSYRGGSITMDSNSFKYD
jgi:SRP40, C-terminal domain